VSLCLCVSVSVSVSVCLSLSLYLSLSLSLYLSLSLSPSLPPLKYKVLYKSKVSFLLQLYTRCFSMQDYFQAAELWGRFTLDASMSQLGHGELETPSSFAFIKCFLSAAGGIYCLQISYLNPGLSEMDTVLWVSPCKQPCSRSHDFHLLGHLNNWTNFAKLNLPKQ